MKSLLGEGYAKSAWLSYDLRDFCNTFYDRTGKVPTQIRITMELHDMLKAEAVMIGALPPSGRQLSRWNKLRVIISDSSTFIRNTNFEVS